MDEYIRREDAIKCIEDQCTDGKMWGNDDSELTLIEAYSAIDDLIAIPPTDVAKVRHGRWKPYHEADIGYDEYGVRCSNCKFEVEDHEVNFIMKYCPNCGARMDGGAD